MSLSAFVLVDAILLIGNHTISEYLLGNGDCVEIAPVSGTIAVRDSKDPAGPVLRYSADAWKAFLSEAGQGDFDQVH